MKKIYIESLGCPKNLTDSELIVQNPEEADTILINTCGFIKSAQEESINTILEYKKYPNKKVIVTGCLVNIYKKILKTEIPEVKYFFSTNEFFNNFFNLNYYNALNLSVFKTLTPKSYTYVKVSEGCNRRCSFCIIPKIKGKQYSKPIKVIIEEIKQKIKKGFREIILVGQDLTSFGQDTGESLSLLLKKIEKINLNFKVRLLYLYPDKKLIDLVKQINDSEKIYKYLDIPIQHISEKILSLMNRPSSKNFYENLFYKIKKINENITLRTTFLIGFPGESYSDFKKLVNFIKTIKFNWVGFYAYSDEELSASYKLTHKVRNKAIQHRIEKIINIQKEITSNWLFNRVNKIYTVYVDEIIKNEYLLTHSECEAPEIDGNIIIKFSKKNIKIGNQLRVRIINSFDYDLIGEIVK